MENGVMDGIHDVLPEDADEEEESISLKKLKKQDAQWNLEKEVLVFQLDGIKKTTWLSVEKRDALLLMVLKWIQGSNKRKQQNVIGTITFK